MKKILKNNVKLLIGIIIGGIIFGGSAYVLATTIASSSVAYTENGQTTVEGALTDLYQKADTWINPNIELNKITSVNTAGTVFATKDGLCIVRKGKLNCFKINNWAEEKDHIQQVFSDTSCIVKSSNVNCDASDFGCSVYSNGLVICLDPSDYSSCSVSSAGSIDCT